MHEISIASFRLSPSAPPWVIAELSGNHNQNLDRALALIDAAAAAGAHALKLQTYTADTMTLDLAEGDFVIHDPDSPWYGQSLYKLYQQAHTPWDWHAPIFERARERGLIPFSTPFDETSVDFLESLDVPCYKIASFENGDIPLIRRVAATGKPLLMSTGTATLDEVAAAVAAARAAGCKDLVLLKCTSNYPADPEDANLATLPYLQETFDCVVGISDHTRSNAVPVAAVALGARVIEKHLTLSRSEGGVDAAFSLEPHEFKLMAADVRLAWTALGKVCCEPTAREQSARRHRRSLYVVVDVQAGELFSTENVRAIRPGAGLPPKYLDNILGQPAACEIKRGTPLSWAMLRDAAPPPLP
jgi:pseudaminic acid synthase